MLKYRVILSFVAMWCVVSLSYMGVRTAIGAWTAGAGAIDDGATARPSAPASQTDSQSDPSPTEVEGQEETQAMEEPAATEEPPAEEAPAPEAPVAQEAPTVPDVTESAADIIEGAPAPPAVKETPEPTAEDTAAPREAAPDTVPADEEVAWTQEPAEPAQDQTAVEDRVPSLEEYLSRQTCGSCRRNCPLSSPSCRRGSRLAQLKAQEYDEIYGQ